MDPKLVIVVWKPSSTVADDNTHPQAHPHHGNRSTHSKRYSSNVYYEQTTTLSHCTGTPVPRSAAKAEVQEWIRAWYEQHCTCCNPHTPWHRRARTLEKQLQQGGSLWDIVSDYAAWALALGTLYGGNLLLADVRFLVTLLYT